MYDQTLTLRSKGMTTTVDLTRGLSAKDVATRINSQQNQSGGVTARAETYAFIAFGTGATCGGWQHWRSQQGNQLLAERHSNSSFVHHMRTDLDGLVTAINDVSAKPASLHRFDLPGSSGSYRIQLFAADGRDIQVSNTVVSMQSAGSASNVGLMQIQGAYDSNGTIIGAGATNTGSSGVAFGVRACWRDRFECSAQHGCWWSRDVYQRYSLHCETQVTSSGSSSGTGGLLVGSVGQMFGGDKTDTLSGVNITTALGANKALDVIDAILARISSNRSKLSAMQNRFQMTVKTCKLRLKTCPLRAAASAMQTSPKKPPTCRVGKRCNRLAPPCCRKLTSVRKLPCKCSSNFLYWIRPVVD